MSFGYTVYSPQLCCRAAAVPSSICFPNGFLFLVLSLILQVEVDMRAVRRCPHTCLQLILPTHCWPWCSSGENCRHVSSKLQTTIDTSAGAWYDEQPSPWVFGLAAGRWARQAVSPYWELFSSVQEPCCQLSAVPQTDRAVCLMEGDAAQQGDSKDVPCRPYQDVSPSCLSISFSLPCASQPVARPALGGTSRLA